MRLTVTLPPSILFAVIKAAYYGLELTMSDNASKKKGGKFSSDRIMNKTTCCQNC